LLGFRFIEGDGAAHLTDTCTALRASVGLLLFEGELEVVAGVLELFELLELLELLAEVVELFELLELLEKVVAEVEEVVAEVLAEVEEVVAEVLEVLKEVLKEVLAEVLEEMYVKTCKRGNVFEMHPISTVNSMVFSALWCTRR
tara:strand:- start:467 stop:898 length:432 start_codon:yes stop_codon:yes gene_type:complete